MIDQYLKRLSYYITIEIEFVNHSFLEEIFKFVVLSKKLLKI